MQTVHKDIDSIVYRFVHRDLTKLVNQEYHTRLRVCDNDTCDKVCEHCIQVTLLPNITNCIGVGIGRYKFAFNYRDVYKYDNVYANGGIYDKYNQRCAITHINY